VSAAGAVDALLARITGRGRVRRIELVRDLSAPIERVWCALTELDALREWWPDWRLGGVVEPREGGRIRLGNGDWIDGEIRIWRPPHLFEFSWNDVVPMDHVKNLEPVTRSLVRFDLVENGHQRTMLHLVQFAGADVAVGGAAGWHEFAGERLPVFLASGAVPADPERFAVLHGRYAAAYPS
jgi:uncharacterized protein YndB with AHSA1/START domain